MSGQDNSTVVYATVKISAPPDPTGQVSFQQVIQQVEQALTITQLNIQNGPDPGSDFFTATVSVAWSDQQPPTARG